MSNGNQQPPNQRPQAAQQDPGVSLVMNSEDTAPLDLEPVMISLEITKDLFKTSAGGTAP